MKMLDVLVKLLSSPMIRYALVGVIATVIDVGLFTFLVMYEQVAVLPAAILSFICAVLANFSLGRVFVFAGVRNYHFAHEMLLVISISITGLVVNILAIEAVLRLTSLSPFWAKVIAVFPTFLWNFTIRKLFVYRKLQNQ